MNVLVEKISARKGIIDLSVLKKLINNVSKVEKVKLVERTIDLPTAGLMILSEQSKSLDFLNNPGENIYSVCDLKVKYR